MNEAARHLGLTRIGDQWRGDCPSCGYAKNVFVLTVNRDGSLHGWCAACQDKEGIANALKKENIVQAPAPSKAEKAVEDERKKDAAMFMWNTSGLVRGSYAEAYLKSRGLASLVDSSVLRFATAASRPGERRRWPAMVASVQDVNGNIIGVHRTYVLPDGRKPADGIPKASLGTIWGGAIRLSRWNGETLIIGEGIETAASAGIMANLPAWAAISSGNMAKGIWLPREIHTIVIAADNDEVGLRCAWEARRRWTAEGRDVTIECPPPGGGDFNDMLLRGK